MRIDWFVISTSSAAVSQGSLRIRGLAVNRVVIREGGPNLPFFGAFRLSLDPGDTSPRTAEIVATDPDGLTTGRLKMERSRSDAIEGVLDYVGLGVVRAETPGGYSFLPAVDGKVPAGAPQWVVRIEDERIRINGKPVTESLPIAIRTLIRLVTAERQYLTMTPQQKRDFLDRYGNYMSDEEREHFEEK